MNGIFVGLAILSCLVIAVMVFLKMHVSESICTEKLTLEIREFTTNCGVRKYNCYVPELGLKFIEVLPIGFKPIFDDLVMNMYGLSLEQMYSIPVDVDNLSASVSLYRALRHLENCEVDLPISKHERIFVKVIFIAPKPCLDLPLAA